jgi:hypothetical protein
MTWSNYGDLQHDDPVHINNLGPWVLGIGLGGRTLRSVTYLPVPLPNGAERKNQTSKVIRAVELIDGITQRRTNGPLLVMARRAAPGAKCPRTQSFEPPVSACKSSTTTPATTRADERCVAYVK